MGKEKNKFEAVVKYEGKTAGYQLEDGRILNKDEVDQLEQEEGIQGDVEELPVISTDLPTVDK